MSTEEILAKKIIYEHLKYAIDMLPSKEKEVLILRYYEGLTLKKVGEKMGVGGDRIRQIEAKALKRLRTNKIIKRIGAMI